MDKINIIKATPNFPFLEATIDGLSYYQLLAGLNAYINTVVDLINSTGIETWKETVDKISAQVSVLESAVNSNTNSINSISSKIGDDELKTDEKTLIGAINELFSTIASIETSIGNDNLSTTADTLIGAINELVSDIAGLDESSDEFKTDIANLKNSVTKNTNDISQLKVDVMSNTTDILKNTTDISRLKTNVQTNTDGLATAKTDISQLKTSAQTNTDDLATAKTDIIQLKTNVQTNTDDLSTANLDITKLKTDYTLLDGRVTAVEEVEDNNNNDITALKTKVGTSALATTSQNLSDAVNELKSAIGTGGEGEKTPVTSETTITVSGTTAVDAVQLNPNGVDGNGNDGLGNKTFAKKLEENSGVIKNYDSRLTVVETTTAGLATDINSAKSNISSLQEDSEMFTSDITTITNNIGKLTELTTTVKNTLVDAINEVNAKPSGGGETTPISNNTNITTTGKYALDAVQNNADVADTLRNLIAGLQSLYNTLSGNVTELTSKVSTNTSDISDLTNSVSSNTNNIGTLTDLTTTDKDTLVNAINEINAKPSGETTPISNETNITATGTYALDAVQNNENIDNSLRKLIKDLTALVGSLDDLNNAIVGNTIVDSINNLKNIIPDIKLTNNANTELNYGLLANLLRVDKNYKMSEGGLDATSTVTSGNITAAQYGNPAHLTIGQFVNYTKDIATTTSSTLFGCTSDIDDTDSSDKVDLYGFGNIAFLNIRNITKAQLTTGYSLATFLNKYGLDSYTAYDGVVWDNTTGLTRGVQLDGESMTVTAIAPNTLTGNFYTGFILIKTNIAIFNA